MFQKFALQLSEHDIIELLNDLNSNDVLKVNSIGLASFVSRLKSRREKIMTQLELAQSANLSIGTIINYENNSYNSATMKNIIKIAGIIERYEVQKSKSRSQSRRNRKRSKS